MRTYSVGYPTQAGSPHSRVVERRGEPDPGRRRHCELSRISGRPGERHFRALPRPARRSGGVRHLRRVVERRCDGPADHLDIVGSSEFFSEAGGTAAGFVNLAYQRILGRAPDSSGVGTFLGLLNAEDSRIQTAYDLLTSSEYQADTVFFYFSYLLGRAPDPSGHSTFVGLFNSGGSVEQLISHVVGSTEYDNDANS